MDTRIREYVRHEQMMRSQEYILETAGFVHVDLPSCEYVNLRTGERLTGVRAWIYSSILWTRVEALERFFRLPDPRSGP
jgi:histidyl-tRNA synthetase